VSNLLVLIHGLHVDSKDWMNLVWGNPKEGMCGRAARGILDAVSLQADVIFWGTGRKFRYRFGAKITQVRHRTIVSGHTNSKDVRRSRRSSRYLQSA